MNLARGSNQNLLTDLLFSHGLAQLSATWWPTLQKQNIPWLRFIFSRVVKHPIYIYINVL